MEENKKWITCLYRGYIIRRSQDVLRLASIIKEMGNFTEDDYNIILEKTESSNSSQHIIILIKKYLKLLVDKQSFSNKVVEKISYKTKNERLKYSKEGKKLLPIQKLMRANNKVYCASDFIFKHGLIICDGFKLKTVRAKYVDSAILKNIDATFRINAKNDGSFYFNPATDLSRFLNIIDLYYDRKNVIKINRGVEILHSYVLGKLKSIRKQIEYGEFDILIPADSIIRNINADIYEIYMRKINLIANIRLNFNCKMPDIIKSEIIKVVGPYLFDTVILTYIKRYPLVYDISDTINMILYRTKINIDNKINKILAISKNYKLKINHNCGQITSIELDGRGAQYVSYIHIVKVEKCIYENRVLLQSKELYRGCNMYDYLTKKLLSLHKQTSDIRYIKIDKSSCHPFKLVQNSIKGAYMLDDRNDHYSDKSFKEYVKCILIEWSDVTLNNKITFFDLYTNDKTKSVYRFRCETENRSMALFIIWSYFTAYINNKREYFRDYEDVFQAFGVRGYSKLDSMAIPAPYIQHNFMDWDSLFSLDIRVELN